jgi:hypothetical protein
VNRPLRDGHSGGLVIEIGFGGSAEWPDDEEDSEEEVYYGEGLDQDLGEAFELMDQGDDVAAEAKLRHAEEKYRDPSSLHEIYCALAWLYRAEAESDAACRTKFLACVDKHLDLLELSLAEISEKDRTERVYRVSHMPEPYKTAETTLLSPDVYRLSVGSIAQAAIFCQKQGDPAKAREISLRAAALGLDEVVSHDVV